MSLLEKVVVTITEERLKAENPDREQRSSLGIQGVP